MSRPVRAPSRGLQLLETAVWPFEAAGFWAVAAGAARTRPG